MVPKKIIKKFDNGIIWSGANQTIRMIQNGNVDVVLIATDVDPIEIILPIKNIVKIKNIEHYYSTKAEISKITKCYRPTSAACLIKRG